MEIDKETVLLYLASLGNSSEEIADTLQKLRIKGKRSMASKCPISQALFVQFGKDSYVTPADVMVADGQYGRYTGSFVVPLPDAVSRFVIDFDHEKYPKLEAK